MKALKRAIFFLLLAGFCCQSIYSKQIFPVAQNGVMHFTGWHLQTDEIVPLIGEWEFYWNQLLSPKDFNKAVKPVLTEYVQVPGYWNEYKLKSSKKVAMGYATYRLRIAKLTPNQRLSLNIPTIHSSYSIYINDKLLFTCGIVGTSKSSSLPRDCSQKPGFRLDGDSLDIIVQISNFRHARGGFWQPIEIGSAEAITTKSSRELALDLFLIGAILIMGLYHLGLFSQRSEDKSNLFFGIFCLFIALRTSFHNSFYFHTLFPDYSWDIYLRMDYSTLYVPLISFFLFFQKLYPHEFSKRALFLGVLISSVFGITTLITSTYFFSSLLTFFQVVMILGCLYILYVIIFASIMKREGAAVVLTGCIILAFSIVNDILFARMLINTTFIASFGLCLFMFAQSYVISKRFSNTFRMVEELSGHLEQKVKDRTHELNIKNLQLEQSNQKIISSIEYAQRIQKSLLPSKKLVQSIIPDSFIIWRPRDIVGGDVYYIDQFDNNYLVSVMDCTGHGVPGAFMTMLASSSLRRITVDEHCLDPAEILKRINSIVKTSLQQDTEYVSSDDGLDASICFVNPQEKRLTYAGARLPLTYIHNGSIQILKGDRQSIGYKKSDLDFEFTNHQIDIEDGMVFYLYTDGIADQLGGERQFPFSKRKLNNLLLESHNSSFNEQKDRITKSFDEYKGRNEIQDDVSVIGFRVRC